MAQLPALNILSPFLSRRDTEALRGVSCATAEDPRSLQERLLAMTRRANTEQHLLGKRTTRHGEIESAIVGRRAKLADLLRERFDLEVLIRRG